MSTPPDPFEFARNLWAQMGIPGFAAGPAPAMPGFAPEDLEKRIGELKQIRHWLEINLNMLNLQVNGLEMQLSALKGFKASPGGEMAAQAARAMQDAVAGKGAFATPPAAEPAAPPPAAPSGRRAGSRRSGGASAKAPAWPDPTAWMQTLQAEFVNNMKSVGAGAGAAAKTAAAGTAAPDKAAAGTSSARRSRRAP